MTIRGIIDVNDFGLSGTYMVMSEEARYNSCVLVIEKALQSINMTGDIETKKKYMNTILQKSIEYYVSTEEYEGAFILNDLKEVLNTKY